MPLAGEWLRRGFHDFKPDGERARERDRVHPRVCHERCSHVALARKKRDCSRLHASSEQRLHQTKSAARRLLGGLEHDRVSGCEGRGCHPAGYGEREVPWRDDPRHPSWHVLKIVALALHLDQLAACGQLDRAARVVVEEIDCLAHVGVCLHPRLGALPDLERRELEPAIAHPVRRANQRLCPLTRAGGPPGAKPLAGGRDSRGDVSGRGRRSPGDGALGLTRVGRDQPCARLAAYVLSDDYGEPQRQLAVDRSKRILVLGTDRGLAQLEHRLVRERRECRHVNDRTNGHRVAGRPRAGWSSGGLAP